MNADALLDAVESIADGNPSPEALAWLQAGFRRYLDTPDATLTGALGLDAAFQRGLRDAVRTRRVHRAIQAAARLLDFAQQSTRSIALTLQSELRRLQRRPGRTASTGVEHHLLQAVRDGCPMGLSALWDIVSEGRKIPASIPIQNGYEGADNHPIENLDTL